MAPDRSILEVAVWALSRHTDRRGIDETTVRTLRSQVSEEEATLPIDAIAQLILDRGFNRNAESGASVAAVRATALSELTRAETCYLEAEPDEVENARETYMRLLREFESS